MFAIPHALALSVAIDRACGTLTREQRLAALEDARPTMPPPPEPELPERWGKRARGEESTRERK